MGLLDGKVILITGAGNGLGRAYALAAAREGARVVVNDLGGTRDGLGGDAAAADQVVAEIRALGGEAIPNYDSVTSAEGASGMVAAALAAWGRLDGVVNNAGILRDGTFRKMTDAQWASVLDVHLNGTYNVSRAAADALAVQGGSIVNTSSISGMIGNFGQSNYAAAKAGIYGLTRVLALELRKWNVTANCVAPIAKTRMTEDIDRVEQTWTPDHVAPMVIFLLSDLARGVTGRVFGVRGNHMHVYEVHVNDGVEKPGEEPWTPAEIAEKLEAITSFEAPAPTPAPASASKADPLTEVFAHMPAAFMADKAGSYKAVLHFVFKDAAGRTVRIGDGKAVVEDGLSGTPDCTIKSDAETFAGIATGTLDAQKAFMKGRITADNMGVLMKFAMYFRFERPADAGTAGRPAESASAQDPAAPAGPRVWPIGKTWDGGFSFVEPRFTEQYAAATGDEHVAYLGPDAVAPPMFHVRLFKPLLFAIATDPELGLDMLRLVHGEHDVTFHRPLRVWDLVQLRARLDQVEEKSSGLVVTSRLLGFVEGQLVVEARTVFFIRAATRAPKGEGKAEAPAPIEAPRAPDVTREIKVAADQSYRYAEASLDDNPIHVDPETARAAGLPDVILQGLCTMAFAGRAVVSAMIPGRDPTFLRRLSVRFARPVRNGATLTTQIWKRGKVAEFVVKNELGEVVISNGLAEVR